MPQRRRTLEERLSEYFGPLPDVAAVSADIRLGWWYRAGEYSHKAAMMEAELFYTQLWGRRQSPKVVFWCGHRATPMLVRLDGRDPCPKCGELYGRMLNRSI